MILYHGTTYNNFKSIFYDKEISVTTDENSHNAKEGRAKTTRGFVYLADSPLTALEFAAKSWLNQEGNCIEILSVIKMEVPDEELEKDLDEEFWNSTTLPGKFFRIARPINYNTEVKAVAFFQFGDFDECCKYFESHQPDYIVWSPAECPTLDEKIWNGASGPMTPLAYGGNQ